MRSICRPSWIHYNRFLAEIGESFAHRWIIIGNNGVQAFNFSFHRLLPPTPPGDWCRGDRNMSRATLPSKWL